MRGSGGPCDHCGRTQSPCWRKGPPEKNTLCNACGARWLVKKSLQNYWPGEPTAKSYGTAKPRSKPRKPRSTATTVQIRDQGSVLQRRAGVTTASMKKLSPAAQAAYAQLTILTKLEQHGMRLAASAQPPLFQTADENNKPVHWTPQRDALALAPSAPQLLLLPGVSIQVKDFMPAKLSLFTDVGASLRRRARKQAHVTRASA